VKIEVLLHLQNKNINMKDLEVLLENTAGALAQLGETLGRNKISLEGGGAFANGNMCIAHYLVNEPGRANAVLMEAGIKVTSINPVIIVKLRQDVPGQLGLFCRQLADAGVNILTQYSDHANQLIIVVDHQERGEQVAEAWMKEWW
jgi:hypothetical protein